ncbi:penicillin-binding transpeptidase domain-containing protein [Streptomyces sp. W1SF4]|uniref:penicillin-binding transpeptidase domain-containing protein n=1 Tax=Streptomyces sp. W1SF4 TaxID=2305220 RepID=UPI000F6F3C52|nr:penicillin-binding transpeptidase domain-containing protein [Streptomyces sp. W1SF4]AZM92688.1 penicillin-binding protein [Streptomyces sp. W1SF4]
MSPSRRRPALVLTAVSALLAACVTGCGPGARDTNASDARPGTAERPGTAPGTKAPAPEPGGGLGDILVAGRPVTGSQASGIPKAPFKRTYTEGELYAPVTGYRSMAFGAVGLEAVFREELDAGKDVATTIDPAVQRAAFDGLRGRQGAAVVLDADSGRILGQVSTPSYDPNSFSGNLKSDERAWNQLKDQGFDGPLTNRAIRHVDNPGSAVHVVVAAAALEKGLIASVDAPTRSPAVHTAADSTAEFAGDPAHCTDASLRTALRHACANVFARIASDLGADALASTAVAFGFNQDKTDTPLRAFESTWPRKPENPAQLALMANGLFEVKATPIQMAMVTAVLANGGNRVRPSLVTDPRTPVPAERAVSQRTAEQLQSALGDSSSAWVPSASVTWATSSARTPAGRRLAVAVCLSSPTDATAEATPLARHLAAAGQ